MTIPDKMELLEALWDDLSRRPEQLQSPDWHKVVLEERREAAEAGEDKFSDWETAKEDIRKRVL